MAETPATLNDTAARSTNQTGRAVLIVTGGRITLQGAWFVATMLLARVLGPPAFATYTLATKAIQIFTDCFGDPLDMAVMREAPLHLRNDRQIALDVIRSAFWMRIVMGLLSIAFAAALPWVAATVIFGSADRPRGCHRLCEQRDQGLHDRGIWLWSWENPRLVPVQLCDQQGPRHPAWLTDEGTYDFEGPAGGIGVRSPLKSRVAVL